MERVDEPLTLQIHFCSFPYLHTRASLRERERESTCAGWGVAALRMRSVDPIAGKLPPTSACLPVADAPLGNALPGPLSSGPCCAYSTHIRRRPKPLPWPIIAVPKAFSNHSPHSTPPKHTIYYILLPPSKRFPPYNSLTNYLFIVFEFKKNHTVFVLS